MISQELKNIITNFIKEKKNTIFLETGFYKGISAETALKLGFSKVISIEIDQSYIAEGEKKLFEFVKTKRLKIIHGDSTEKIETEYNENITVIFLDAHGENTNKDHKNVAPLERELNFILPKMGQDQLLIIDDYLKIIHYDDLKKKNWKSFLSSDYFKSIIKKYNLNHFQIPYMDINNIGNSYLILSKDENFKINFFRKFLINLKYNFNIPFYLFWKNGIIWKRKLVKIKNFFN